MELPKIYILLILSFIICNSCDSLSPNKFVEENPKSILTDENFPQTESDVKAAVNSIYAGLFSVYSPNFLGTMNFKADYIESRASRQQSAAYQVNSTTIQRMSAPWSSFYGIIGRANKAISAVDKVVEDPTLKNRLKGEALFLRAFSHFVIVRLYGAAPIRTKPVVSISKTAASRVSASDVLKQIIDDFQKSVELLPEENGLGRPTKAAAETALTSVYLWQGSYQKVMDEALEVINSGKYRLVETLPRLYDPDKAATNEILFELRQSREIGSSTYLKWIHAKDWPQFSPNYGLNIANTKTFIGTWDDSDLRKKWNLYGNNIPTLMADGSITHFDFGQNKIYVAGKFRDANAISPGKVSLNYPIFRYAETLLNYVEADIRQDGKLSSKGREYWNMVRRRGYGKKINQSSNIDISINNLSKPQLLDEIFLERGKEFMIEAKRWYDMKRFDKVEELITNAGHTFQSRLLLWPIPEEEINNNSKITKEDQNPGW